MIKKKEAISQINLETKEYEFKVPSYKLNTKIDIKNDSEGTIYYIRKDKMSILSWIILRFRLIYIFVKVRIKKLKYLIYCDHQWRKISVGSINKKICSKCGRYKKEQ